MGVWVCEYECMGVCERKGGALRVHLVVYDYTNSDIVYLTFLMLSQWLNLTSGVTAHSLFLLCLLNTNLVGLARDQVVIEY